MVTGYHPTPLSGGDREALAKELGKARAMANILAAQSAEKGEVMIQQADRLPCESWNERMWSDGDSPTSFLDDTPTARLIRQVLGAVSEFEKAMLVAKLKGVRSVTDAGRGAS
jgi:hypothetical protein